MTDILCAVCGEPWDEYGARHGDMSPWEWTLFRQGAGCPCCDGVAPDGANPDDCLIEHLRSVVMESEEPDKYAQLHDMTGVRPRWQRPPDPVLWSCTACGAQVKKDVDLAGDDSLYWSGSKVPSFPRDEWEATLAEHPKPASILRAKPYCPACLVTCGGCGELVLDDTTHPDHRFAGCSSLCPACYEQLSFCPECGEVEDDGDACSCTASADADADDECDEPDDS